MPFLKLNPAWCIAAALAVLLSACTVGPDFVRPPAGQAAWHSPLPHGGTTGKLLHWWEQWNDPTLMQLISQAEQHNPTLDMAVAKLAEARANAGVSDATAYPSVGAAAAVNRSKSVFGGQVFQMTQDSFRFDAGWEIDLFGRVRRGKEAAQARLQSGIAGWHEARVSLAAEVAAAYVELRACETGISLAEQELASRRTTRDLAGLRQDAGFISAAEQARNEAAWSDAAAALAARQADCAHQINRMAALTGMDYAELLKELQARRGQLPVPAGISPETIAAHNLSQRPDVAGAESEWAAASADIGAAKADLFPSLHLLGSLGTSRLVTAGTTSNVSTWSFGPELKIPIFDGGGYSGRVKAAKARYSYAQANYRKTVLAAAQETEDALAQLDAAGKRTQQNARALEQYRTLLQASTARLDAGMANQLQVEEARRGAWAAESALLGSRRDGALAWIALYKTLGGGWQEEDSTAKEKNETGK